MIDPVTKSVIWNRLLSVCREMSDVIVLTSQNFITAELHDFCVALYDFRGRSVAHFVGLPGQLGAGRFQLKSVLEKYGSHFRPGDVILLNDPYRAYGTHLPDITLFRPIFYNNELVFFAMARAHQEDVGGAFPGGYFPGAFDVHAEGLLIPPIKIFDGGKRTETYDFFLNNVRFPEGMKIDNAAMIASMKVAETRLGNILSLYGKKELFYYIDDIIDSTEKAVRAEIERMPQGTFYAESAGDDDGTHFDVNVRVRCELTIKGDTLTFDFSNSDKQVELINCPLSATYASVYAAVFTALDPSMSSYHNEGSYRSINVLAPPGTVVNPIYPATVGAAPVTMGTQVLEAAAQALSQAVPQNICAAWSRHYGFGAIGTDPRTRERYVFLAHVSDGGSGAIWGYDGWPHVSPWPAGGELVRAPVEMIEIYFPWRVVRYELLTDSAGAGKFRGGLGIHWEGVNEGGPGILLTGDSDGDITQGYGIMAGRSPTFFNSMYIIRENGERIQVRAKRRGALVGNETFIQKTAGGCGVGDPFMRDIEKVQYDVRNGYVSAESARSDYGVVLNLDTFEVDSGATDKLRLGD